jgi:NADPH:quinone reductase-like Zn-dependent oxidoreductase
VLVEVFAVALNHRDKIVVETGRGLALRFPFSLGSDLAGHVLRCRPSEVKASTPPIH